MRAASISRVGSISAASLEYPDLRAHGYVFEGHLGEGSQCEELGCKLYRHLGAAAALSVPAQSGAVPPAAAAAAAAKALSAARDAGVPDAGALHAVKFMLLGCGRENRLARMQREVVNLWRCDHRFISAIKSILIVHHQRAAALPGMPPRKSEYYLAIATEYCDGGELSTALAQGGRDERWRMERFAQLLSALEYIHEDLRMCHRDLKLDNIMLKGPNEEVRVVDFGLSKGRGGNIEDGSDPKSSVGTPAYMAPEVLGSSGRNGDRYKGDKADVWSLGVLLYFLRYHELPFGGLAGSAGRPEIGNLFTIIGSVRAMRFVGPRPMPWRSPAEDLIMRMLVREPEKRYSISDIWGHEAMRQYVGYRHVGRHARVEGQGALQSVTDAEMCFGRAVEIVRALTEQHRLQMAQQATPAHEVDAIIDDMQAGGFDDGLL